MIKAFLKKLILGKPSLGKVQSTSAIERRIYNIKSIWNNEQDDDIGIEKLLRLFLAVSQFFFLGTYIKHYFGKKRVAYQELSIDCFVLFKVLFPLFVIYNNYQHQEILFFFLMWFLIETTLYVPTLIFASDIFSRPRSYRRSMLLLFLNYLEIIFSFAVLYSRNNYLNKPFSHWYDSIYFSFITSASIGFGDFYPTTPLGKFLVSFQSILFLCFIVIFINFFSAKIEQRGYFDHNKK